MLIGRRLGSVIFRPKITAQLARPFALACQPMMAQNAASAHQPQHSLGAHQGLPSQNNEAMVFASVMRPSQTACLASLGDISNTSRNSL